MANLQSIQFDIVEGKLSKEEGFTLCRAEERNEICWFANNSAQVGLLYSLLQ
jgi:hypothetical protein